MHAVGYNNKTEPKRSLIELYRLVAEIAENKYGIVRSASGRERKNNRMKREYRALTAKIRQSGRDGSDQDLF